MSTITAVNATPAPTSAPTPAANVDVGRVGQQPHRFTIAIPFNVTGHTPTSISLTHASLREAVSLFESVELVSARVSLAVPPGAAGSIGVCFRSSTSALTASSDVAVYSHHAIVYLSHEAPRLTLDLPAGHAFGRELLGVATGNAAPVVTAIASGLGQHAANFRFIGAITLVVSGSGTPADPVVVRI